MRPPMTRDALAAAGLPAAPAPVRIVHLGLGAFHRAHQAWYTARAGDAAEWGIAAFTGRSPDAAVALEPQDGTFTLVVRDADGDRIEAVTSIVEVLDGAALDRLRALLARPEVAIVTTTVTERGYRLRWNGSLDLDDVALEADLAAIARGGTNAPTTLIGRLLVGLAARRDADAGPLAVVPCDNVPGNGPFLERGVLEAAARVDARLRDWIARSVSFVSTSVDRITPRLDPAEAQRALAAAPWEDRAPVITEAHSDWVLSGTFPGGRPRWEDAGARFVDDIEPWERRKLWMLNGAHTLLALAGSHRGHRTVADAMDDDALVAMVDALWLEASRHLEAELDAEGYAERLRARFRNPRVEHLLAQIAQDSTAKLRLRIVPIAEAELAAGRVATGCASAIAHWLERERTVDDVTAIASLSEELAASAAFVDAVRAQHTAPSADAGEPSSPRSAAR